MVRHVYFVEWEFCRIIPLSADRDISVGALYARALHSYSMDTGLVYQS